MYNTLLQIIDLKTFLYVEFVIYNIIYFISHELLAIALWQNLISAFRITAN